MPIIQTQISAGKQPTGTKTITGNGIVDVSDYANADVQVPTTAPDYYIELKNTNGSLTCDSSKTVKLNGVTEINTMYLFGGLYADSSSITSFDLDGIIAKKQYCCANMFQNCTSLTNLHLGSFTPKNEACCQYMFYGCSGLTGTLTWNTPSIEYYFSCYRMFQGTHITSLVMPKLFYVEGNSSFAQAFRSQTYLTSVSFPNLFYISNAGCMTSCFEDCTNLSSIYFPKLVASGMGGMESMFRYNTSLTSVSFPIYHHISLRYCFYGCTNLSSVDLSKVSVLYGSDALNYTFQNCTSLTSLSFPNLFYASSKNYNTAFANMLKGCSGVTIHFPANWQTTMSSWSNVTNGFGGTNTTVLFDLPDASVPDYDNIEITKNVGFGSLFLGSDIQGIKLNNLVRADDYSGLQSTFKNCTNLTSVKLTSLRFVGGSYMLQNTFEGCTSLTSLYFPAISSNIPYSAFYRNAYNVPNVSFHFPKNTETVIKSLNGYSSTAPFGAISGEVLFDLPSTFILTSTDTIEYERNPIDDTATSLAWRKAGYDENGFVLDWTSYYTSGLTDPQVGDTIYSDAACTTAVITIDSIA